MRVFLPASTAVSILGCRRFVGLIVILPHNYAMYVRATFLVVQTFTTYKKLLLAVVLQYSVLVAGIQNQGILYRSIYAAVNIDRIPELSSRIKYDHRGLFNLLPFCVHHLFAKQKKPTRNFFKTKLKRVGADCRG